MDTSGDQESVFLISGSDQEHDMHKPVHCEHALSLQIRRLGAPRL